MNIIYQIILKFIKKEKLYIAILFSLTLIQTLFQINGISFITANIITFMQKKEYESVNKYFIYFVIASFVLIFIFYIYKIVQNKLVIELMSWVKKEILGIIFKTNNENFSNINFTEFITPLSRISQSMYLLFYNILTEMIPNIGFILMISLYFIYTNTFFGILFFIANMFIIIYLILNWNNLMKLRMDYEDKINYNEKYLIDILNNMDKIILRGKMDYENDIYNELVNVGIKKTINFYDGINNHLLHTTIIVYIIVLMSIFYLITLCMNKKISVTVFITFFTILLLYRDRIVGTFQNLSDYLEFIGRIKFLIKKFDSLIGEYNEEDYDKDYKDVELTFKEVVFDNVSFKYQGTNDNIFNNLNMKLDTNKNHAIGIVGYSGKGKSTFVKMILKLYKCDSGKILIDGKDIQEIDTIYLRQNITYINQNSRLFDKKIIENILYACNDLHVCKSHLNEIQKYKKIQELLKRIDIHNKTAGLAGENLSGGQRQIVNVINGLINPCKILILDEPTSALDGELKNELLQLINDFKKHKQCIIIITHDRDVYPLLDKTITF
jgi:ABC-type bacteriocin/lantibiotic exporter with double-glycine peptidase domain